jgi:hypothetical protein
MRTEVRHFNVFFSFRSLSATKMTWALLALVWSSETQYTRKSSILLTQHPTLRVGSTRPGLVSARGNPSWTQLLSPQSFPRHLATFMPLHHIGVYASYRTIENAGSTPNVYEIATYT